MLTKFLEYVEKNVRQYFFLKRRRYLIYNPLDLLGGRVFGSETELRIGMMFWAWVNDLILRRKFFQIILLTLVII